ncbi:MAG: TRL-like family protein [Leptospira sp.]|nr:TRL-like family protein [Leptospira sp.]
MKKILFYSVFILGFVFFANCSTPVPSLILNVTEQHVYNSQDGQLTSAKVLKTGRSCSWTFFPIFLFYYGMGGSIEEAKKEGGITKVAVVDRESVNFLGIVVNKECVIVWGE